MVSRLLKQFRRRVLLRQFDRHMFWLTCGGTRKAGATQAQIYRAALVWQNRMKRPNSIIEMRKHRKLFL